MGTYNTSEFKAGLKIMLDKEPCAIIENELVKPGKGQAFNRVKFRNLKTGRVLEKTFKSGESIPAADVTELELQYLYSNDVSFHFMHPKSYEQYSANKTAVGDAGMWLKEQDICTVILDDIDLDNGTLIMQRKKTGVLRVSCLWGETISELKQYLAGRNDDSPYLFISKIGKPYKPLRLSVIFRSWTKKLGLSNTLCWEHIRDGAQTVGAQSGIPLDNIRYFKLACNQSGYYLKVPILYAV